MRGATVRARLSAAFRKAMGFEKARGGQVAGVCSAAARRGRRGHGPARAGGGRSVIPRGAMPTEGGLSTTAGRPEVGRARVRGALGARGIIGGREGALGIATPLVAAGAGTRRRGAFVTPDGAALTPATPATTAAFIVATGPLRGPRARAVAFKAGVRGAWVGPGGPATLLVVVSAAAKAVLMSGSAAVRGVALGGFRPAGNS